MFAKLQGKGEKKPAPVASSPDMDITLKYEQTLHNIKVQREQIDDSMLIIEQKVMKIDQEIRSLVSQGKKQSAKGKIAEMKGYQKQIESYQMKYNMLTQMIIKIQTVQQDADFANLFDEAAKLAKEQEISNDRLVDGMANWQEFQQSQIERDALFKQMAQFGVNDEEIDEEFAKYEMETDQQYIQKANNNFNQIPQQKIPQIQISPQQAKTRVQELLD